MDKYTIYCTEEQTKKALELGAPIELSNCAEKVFKFWDGFTYIIPTAEQMIGWLEEQEDIKEIAIYRYYLCGELYWTCDIYKEDGDYAVNCNSNHTSRKEATFAVIDVALKYLEEIKKNK